jgi:hypothetical protein
MTIKASKLAIAAGLVAPLTVCNDGWVVRRACAIRRSRTQGGDTDRGMKYQETPAAILGLFH